MVLKFGFGIFGVKKAASNAWESDYDHHLQRAVCLRKYFTIATEVGGGMAATGYHTKTRNLARNGDRQGRHEEKDDRWINGNDHF